MSIPCRLIWKIKIKRIQKVALAATLCLTILTILCTVIRVAGVHADRTIKSIDPVWAIYWQFVGANIALTMTAGTAFRALFISGVSNEETPSPESKERWYTKSKRFIRYTLSPRLWRSKRSTEITGDKGDWNRPFELPLQAPRATMTGVRTFIQGQGRTKTGSSHIMHSMVEEGHEDSCPLSAEGRNKPSIMVQQDIAVRSEQV